MHSRIFGLLTPRIYMIRLSGRPRSRDLSFCALDSVAPARDTSSYVVSQKDKPITHQSASADTRGMLT